VELADQGQPEQRITERETMQVDESHNGIFTYDGLHHIAKRDGLNLRSGSVRKLRSQNQNT
jgi:hypothetical protein